MQWCRKKDLAQAKTTELETVKVLPNLCPFVQGIFGQGFEKIASS
jgi:hypothetical protein